jgi:small subunit ribosomal protein S18
LANARRLTNSGKVRERRNFITKPAFCPFCAGKMKVDYKDASMLSHYVSGRGKIESRHRTKACAKHQRRLAQAIKRARFLALLPYAPRHIWETGGVGLRRSRY